MAARGTSITFYRPGYKLVMAKAEMRKDDGDLEVPPIVYRRIEARVWEAVPWRDVDKLRLSAGPVLGLVKEMRRRRDALPPTWRNPVINKRNEAWTRSLRDG